MNVQNGTVDAITDRIANICLLLPAVRTRIESARTLEPDELTAVYVLPGEEAERRTMAFGIYQITRPYTIYLICTKAAGRSVEEELSAVKAAYPYENALPTLFHQRQQLQLNGNDGLVFKALPPSDEGAVLAPMSNNSDQFGMWKYLMDVITIESA
jgi:hypothetical protein